MSDQIKVQCMNGFFSFLVVAFIALKLIGVIHWNWFLVLSPLWGGLIIDQVILIILIVFFEKA